MNKEQQQIIDEVYENYHQENKHVMYLTFLLEEEFTRRIKHDIKFSEKWGLKIEERELSLDERRIHAPVKNIKHSDGSHAYDSYDWVNIPTKLITITYKNETIESYE